jgi:hypothetical protein
MIDGLDLLEEFGDEAREIVAASRVHRLETEKARAKTLRGRIETRRAKSEAVLAEILPADLEEGASYHVISHGDVDALSYLAHAIAGRERVAWCLVSTWCMARADVERLDRWMAEGKVGRVDWYVGEIFPNQYVDEYELVKAVAKRTGGRVCVARNHSKVLLAVDEPSGYYVAIESSANVNTNPRIEQATMTRSRELVDFYAEFYGALRTIDRQNGDPSHTIASS